MPKCQVEVIVHHKAIAPLQQVQDICILILIEVLKMGQLKISDMLLIEHIDLSRIVNGHRVDVIKHLKLFHRVLWLSHMSLSNRSNVD